MANHTWTDEEVKWLITRHKEMKEGDGVNLKELNEEFFQKFLVSVSKAAIDGAIRRFDSYNLVENDQLDGIKKVRSAQLSRAKIAKENRILAENAIVEDAFLETFQNLIKDNPLTIHPPAKIHLGKNNFSRVVVGHISDTHIGADIDPEEMGGINNYSYLQEARRHAFYFEQLANYKTRYRDKSELMLFLNGDLMQGVIHDYESAALMTTQFARALSIYIQGITYVARFYHKVKVVCTTGNHGRFMHKQNKGRVSSAKWDGFHTMLSIAIKTALVSYPNIEIEIPVTPYATQEVLGHNFFIVHGDTVLNVGNVSKTINMASIASQVNDINSAFNKKIDVLLVGHVHKATYQTLDNGTELVINGCLSGTDPFAQSIGILHNHPCQQMFETTREHAVGDMRFVRLKEADDDASLDKIIKPLFGKY